MHLNKLQLWNFRKYGNDGVIDLSKPHLEIQFTKGLNVLIGENNAGKSAIVDAIKIVQKTHSTEWIRLEHEDFYKNSDRLRIVCKFCDMTDEEASHFTEWLGYDVTENGNSELCLNVILDARRKDGKILPFDVKAGVDDEGSILAGEAREYLKITFLKALRDADSELIPKRNSRISQIFSGHEAFKNQEETHYLVHKFKEFNNLIDRYFDGKDHKDVDLSDQKGKELKSKIQDYLKRFNGDDKELSLTTSSKEGLRNILEKLEIAIKDEVNLGLGSLNRLFMASELLHLNKTDWTGIRLGVIEELEAHLHPQVQLQVVETLEQQSDIQLILTTHSPNLASKVKLENLIICNKNGVYPMGKQYTELSEVNYSFLERFLDVTKSNLFFARGVILVEGWTEELLIPAIANKIGINLTEKGVSIVNVGSKAFLAYSSIFKRKDGKFLDIPVAVVTDLDLLPGSSSEKKSTRMDELVEKYNGQKVKTFVSPEWTLEYCLSKSDSLSKIFKEVTIGVHPRISIDGFEEALSNKLKNRGLNKLDIAYQVAQKIQSEDLKIKEDDSFIEYLVSSIKYAAGQD